MCCESKCQASGEEAHDCGKTASADVWKHLQLVLEAEPQHWQSGSSLPGATKAQLHPFARASFGSVNLNLATLQLCR